MRISASGGRLRNILLQFVIALSLGGVFLLAVLQGPILVSDPDVFWHVEAGRYILAHGFPRTDPFSWTALGQPWVDQEWLSQVLMALAKNALGFRGLVALDGCLLVLLWGLVYRGLARWINAPAAILLAWGVLWYASFHVQMRPHLFGLVCTAIWAGELCRGRWRVAPLFFLLWVQLHGSALVLGPVLALLLGQPALATACAALGLVNPYGVGYYEMVLWQFQHSDTMQIAIGELRPVNARHDLYRVVALFGAVGAGLALGCRLGVARAALLCGLGFVSFQHWRGLAFFAVVAPVVVVSSPWAQAQSWSHFWRAFTYRLRLTSYRRPNTGL